MCSINVKSFIFLILRDNGEPFSLELFDVGLIRKRGGHYPTYLAACLLKPLARNGQSKTFIKLQRHPSMHAFAPEKDASKGWSAKWCTFLALLTQCSAHSRPLVNTCLNWFKLPGLRGSYLLREPGLSALYWWAPLHQTCQIRFSIGYLKYMLLKYLNRSPICWIDGAWWISQRGGRLIQPDMNWSGGEQAALSPFATLERSQQNAQIYKEKTGSISQQRAEASHGVMSMG